MADTTRMAKDAAVSVVPANEARWEDLQAVLGTRGDTFRCKCQRYKMRPGEAWASFPVEERAPICPLPGPKQTFALAEEGPQ